ncbi:MAG: hypothetical protein M3O28_00375 [Actinomycetota bacterium]|nr:hypothetical protein [Actinomycetota bacterium]
MGTMLELIVAVLLPTAVGYSAVLALRYRPWAVLHRSAPVERPIGQIEADLRRLHADLDRTELAVGLPGKDLRLNAVRAAYVDTLILACARVGVAPPQGRPSPGRSPVSLAEIYRAEAALRRQGLDVRSPASP